MADSYDHDLDRWRKAILSKRPSKEYLEGFQIADMDDGAMWDLLKQLTAYSPGKRLSAAAALRHPAFGTGLLGRLNVLISTVGNATDKVRIVALEDVHSSFSAQNAAPFLGFTPLEGGVLPSQYFVRICLRFSHSVTPSVLMQT